MKKKQQTEINDFSDNIESVFVEYDDYNSYYESISVIFRVLSFLFIALLLFFIISFSLLGAEEFSYTNLDYISRNFALTLDENKNSIRYPIRYNPDSTNQFDLFGEGLAVCGSSSLSIYSASGRQTCSEFIQYKNPKMSASDKYVLIYDEDTGSYSVYNSFIKTYSDELDEKIRNVAISQRGYYALTLSSDEYISTVDVYNSDFVLMGRYNKNSYVSCVDITDDEILIVSANSSLNVSDYKIEILASDLGATKTRFAVQCYAGFPLGCEITDIGYTVVFTDAVIFLDKNGNILGRYDFDKMNLSDFDISSSTALLLFENKGTEAGYEFLCFDSSADVLYSNSVAETVFDIAIIDGIACVLTENRIFCYNGNSIKSIDIDSADYSCRMLASGEDMLYYCSATSATLINLVNE